MQQGLKILLSELLLLSCMNGWCSSNFKAPKNKEKFDLERLEEKWRKWEVEGEAALWRADSQERLVIEGFRRVNKKRKIEQDDQVLIAPKENDE